MSVPTRSAAARADRTLWLALIGLFVVHAVTRAPWVDRIGVVLACARVGVWVFRIARWAVQRVRLGRTARDASEDRERIAAVLYAEARKRLTEQDAQLLDRVRAAFEEMGEKLGSMTEMPAFWAMEDGLPFVVVRDGVLHIVAVERGQEIGRSSTEDLGEFLRWVALNATRTQAMSFELDRRQCFPEGYDTRIGRAAWQVHLLGRLNQDWAREFRARIPAELPGVRLEDVDAHPLDPESGSPRPTRQVSWVSPSGRG
jgi:hypothetical protein